MDWETIFEYIMYNVIIHACQYNRNIFIKQYIKIEIVINLITLLSNFVTCYSSSFYICLIIKHILIHSQMCVLLYWCELLLIEFNVYMYVCC